MSVLLNTSLGDIVIDLHTDICPVTTKNFLKLCKIKYFNNCLFHSVQKDFLVQTGDPTGTGSGGDSIYKYLYGDQARFFEDEIRPDLKHDKIGVVAMANAGANLNASQFYITTRAELDYLDEKKTIFGEVAEGIDTLMRINEAYVDENNRPYKNIRIKHTYVLDDPFDDPPQLSDLIPDKSPDLKPPAEGDEVRLEDDWVPMDEQQDPEELEKSLRSKEAHSRAVVLEMIGDIPEAEIKPPENVLFICKLNPVTQEEDLEILFSRFGKTISVDIIKDYKTGDSLCYGFIEFETTEACEAAYFKMDNVLIDDRRVHVDFSQSVAKLWTRFRRFGTRDSGAATNYTPQTKGRGCFKCGELGHIAKDCTAEDAKEPNAVLEKPKYILKDIGGQHGDQRNKSYEMVFDERSEPGYVQESRKAGNVHDGRSMKQRRGEGSERRSSPGMSDHKRRRSESPSYYESKDRHGKSPQSATTRNREGTHDGYVPKPDGKERREWEREQGRDKGKIPEYKEKRSTLHTKREDRSVADKFDRTEGDPRNRDDDDPPKHRSRDEINSSHKRDFEKHKDRHRDDRTEHRKHENSDETLSIVERRIDRNGRNIDRNEDKERDHRHHYYHDRASSASRGYQDNSNRRDREKAEYSMNDDRKEREHRRDGNLNKAYYAKGNKQEDEQSRRYTERPREKHKYREKEH